MAIKNAMNLIRDVQVNNELRKGLNSLKPEEVTDYLYSKGYTFSVEEFEETINMLHVKCQTYEEADELMQTVYYIKLLITEFK